MDDILLNTLSNTYATTIVGRAVSIGSETVSNDWCLASFGVRIDGGTGTSTPNNRRNAGMLKSLVPRASS